MSRKSGRRDSSLGPRSCPVLSRLVRVRVFAICRSLVGMAVAVCMLCQGPLAGISTALAQNPPSSGGGANGGGQPNNPPPGLDQAIQALLQLYGTKACSKRKTEPVIKDRTGASFAKTEAEVRQNISKWTSPDAYDPNKILQRTDLWKYFHGAEIGEMLDQYLKDMLDLVLNFHRVNSSPIHTFPQMIIPPIPLVWPCGMHYQYVGFEAGTCYWIFPSLFPWCGFMWIESASLVEYHYPAYKIDSSEQMFQTVYLPNAILDVVAKLLNDIITTWVPQATVQTIQMVHSRVVNEMAAWGYTIPQLQKVPKQQKEALEKLVSALKKNNREEALGSAPNALKAYARTVFEPLNMITLVIPQIPHVPKFHLWGTDLPVGMYGVPGGYFFSKILALSLVPLTGEVDWAKMIAEWLMPAVASYIPGVPGIPGLSGLRRCIENNKSKPKGDPKTPWDIDLGNVQTLADLMKSPPIDMLGKGLGIDICLDLIGETFPFLDVRRLHITDATYQAAWKMLNLFQYMMPLDLLSLDPQKLMESMFQELVKAGISMLPAQVNQVMGYINQAGGYINQAGNIMGSIQNGQWGNVFGQAGQMLGGQYGGQYLQQAGQIINAVAGKPLEQIVPAVVGAIGGDLGMAWISPRHSFIRSIDKWWVLGNELLRKDQDRAGKQGQPIDAMTMVNVALDKVGLKYNEANIKIGRSGGENAFEIWPLFKGCWHPAFKGMEPDFFIESPRPPLIIPPFPWPLFYPSKMPGKLRLY